MKINSKSIFNFTFNTLLNSPTISQKRSVNKSPQNSKRNSNLKNKITQIGFGDSKKLMNIIHNEEVNRN